MIQASSLLCYYVAEGVASLIKTTTGTPGGRMAAKDTSALISPCYFYIQNLQKTAKMRLVGIGSGINE